MDPTVQIAVITSISAVLIAVGSPFLLAWRTDQNALKNKQIDWARQDAVAAKAERVAADLLVEQRNAALRMADLKADLAVVHGLVNSALTAALQSSFDNMTASHAALTASPKNSVTKGKIAALELQMTALALVLGERKKQQDILDAKSLLQLSQADAPPLPVEVVKSSLNAPVRVGVAAVVEPTPTPEVRK